MYITDDGLRRKTRSFNLSLKKISVGLEQRVFLIRRCRIPRLRFQVWLAWVSFVWEFPTGKRKRKLYRFRLSASISRYVLQLSNRKAAMMRRPPEIAAPERGWPTRNQSAIATRKMVRLAGNLVDNTFMFLVLDTKKGLQCRYAGEDRRS